MNFNYPKEIDSFLNFLNKHKYTNSTVYGYIYGLRDFFNFLAKQNISPANFVNNDILHYKNSLIDKNSEQTINTKIYAIKKYIDYLKEERDIRINYNIEIIKTNRKKDIIPIKNVKTITNYINKITRNEKIQKRDKLLIEILYYTGARTKELLKLKKRDISSGTLKLSDKDIIIDKKLFDEINDYTKKIGLEDDNYLFFSFANQKYNFKSPLTEKSVQDIFNKYKKIIDNNLSIIDLRNSHAINLKNNSINIKINKIYSHKILRFNKDYLKLTT